MSVGTWSWMPGARHSKLSGLCRGTEVQEGGTVSVVESHVSEVEDPGRTDSSGVGLLCHCSLLRQVGALLPPLLDHAEPQE